MSDVNHIRLPRTAATSRAKAEGAVIALAAGDALGWPQEMPGRVIGLPKPITPSPELRGWSRRSGGYDHTYVQSFQRGEYSDDTQLTLAVARSRLFGANAWWDVFTRTELPLWPLYQRGGGRATKHAAKCWRKGVSPWSHKKAKQYFCAGGNGVAMRVLPHAIFYSGIDDPGPLVRDVFNDGVATHGHPRALIGAIVYAYAAWWLLRNESTLKSGELVDVLLEAESTWGRLHRRESLKKGWLDAANKIRSGRYKAVWTMVADEMRTLLEQVKEGLAARADREDYNVMRVLGCFGPSMGAGTVSTAAAVYLCSRYATQPIQAVVKAAFALGSDTDTVAAMTGGLAGSLGGTDWLYPDWYSVQDCDYLRKLANAVAQGMGGEYERPKEPVRISKNHIDSFVDKLVHGHKGKLQFDGIREAEVTSEKSPKLLLDTAIVREWQIRIDDGQTIFVTKLGP